MVIQEIPNSVKTMINSIGSFFLNTFAPAIPETYNKMKEGKSLIQSYKEAWQESEEKEKQEALAVAEEYKLAEQKGVSLFELSKIAQKSPVIKKMAQSTIGFMGGMKLVTPKEAEILIAKAVNLTREDLQTITSGGTVDSVKLDAYKTLTKYPELRERLSTIAQDKKIPLMNKITDYVKDLFPAKVVAEKAEVGIPKVLPAEKAIISVKGIEPVVKPVLEKAVKAVIPPELQPLAQEARKYGSAEEFVGFTDNKGRIFKGLTKEEGKTSSPWKWEYEYQGKIYSGHETSQAKAIEIIKNKFTNLSKTKEMVNPPGGAGNYVPSEGTFKLAVDVSRMEKGLPPLFNQAVRGVKEVKPAIPTEVPPVKPPIPPSPAPIEMPQFAGKLVGDPIAKLNTLLKEAKPIRKGLEKAYTEERGKRISEVDRFINEQIDQVGGEEGYAKILVKMKGELVKPEAKIAFEPLKEKLTEEELKALYIRTWKHPYLDNWEKLSAANGLSGLLGGVIPQPKQLVLLEEIYGTDLVKNLLSKRLWGAKAMDFVVEVMNIPRAMLATADMSAFLRQGIIPLVAHPTISIPAVAKTFKFAFSQKSFDQYFKDLPKDPLYPLMRKSGLAITDPSKALASGREESFISRLLQSIPIIKIPVKFAERSYVGFLNKVRVDLFKTWADEFLSKGLSPVKDINYFKSVANIVNTFTGRGGLGKLDRITPELNNIFFSPRLIAARFNALNPVWYARMPKEIRVKAIGDFAKFVSVGLTTLALINLSDDVDVEIDPRSSDFGKIKIGNTRLDIWGGFQQWARVLAQLITGERKNTSTGEIVSLSKEEYPFTTRKETLLRFIEGKLAPVPALINELMSGAKTFTGEDMTFETTAKEKFIPMYIQDIADAYADGGLGRAVGSGVAAFFGVGVQTWEEQKKILAPEGMPQLQMPGMPGMKMPAMPMPGISGAKLPPMPGIK